jgi:hypothetical protein
VVGRVCMKEAGDRSKGVGETSGVYDKAVKGGKEVLKRWLR